MPGSLKGISFMVDAYAQAYCSHVKRTNTVVLLSATLPFTIYLSPRVWGGVGGGWKCTILHYVRCCKRYWVHWSVSSVFSQGLEPGTVVITTRAVNALLEPFSEQVL